MYDGCCDIRFVFLRMGISRFNTGLRDIGLLSFASLKYTKKAVPLIDLPETPQFVS